jgi:hypothetical protein
MKAAAAGNVVVKINKFLKSQDKSLTLSREEVDSILLVIKEQATALKKLRP